MVKPRIPALQPRIPLMQAMQMAQAPRIGATSRDRGRGRQAARLRIWLRDGPHCAGCGTLIDITPGTPTPFELDHTIPLWAGGQDDDSNRQCLCVRYDEHGRKIGCHAEKTAREAGERQAG